MSFFGPITPPLLSEASGPFLRRAFGLAKTVGGFATVQVIVQLISFLAGILIIRALSQTEYAYYTIANTMQATINLLADLGISVGLLSIGGRVWHDRRRFGELIKTGMQLRRTLGTVVVLIIAPVLCFLLIKNGASLGYSVALLLVVLFGAAIQLSVGVLGVVPRLLSNVRLIQKIDLAGALIRLLLLLGVLLLFFLNASIAVAVGTVTILTQYLMLRRYTATVVDLSAPPNTEDRMTILGIIRNQAANTVFYCFQGQIAILLISLFGTRPGAIAEVGALGRLAMIFTVLNNLLANIFVPAFARCQNPRKLKWLYAAILGGVIGFSLLILLAAALFPREFLLILGPKYSHLHQELVLMVGGAVLSILTGTLWGLNASKAWIAGSWLYIPLTLAAQAALIPLVDLSSVRGVLLFNLISAVPNLLLNAALSYRGFRMLQPVA